MAFGKNIRFVNLMFIKLAMPWIILYSKNNNGPKDAYILIPRTFHGRKDFAEVINVEDFKIGKLSGLSS
jgi:hypothetical protein